MLQVCDGDEQCLYDSKAMGSLEVGEATKNAHRYYKFLDQVMKPGKLKKIKKFLINFSINQTKKVNSCGIMAIRGGIRRTSTGNYLAGSRMTVSCESGYTFYGYSDYVCHPNGTWLPANNVPLHQFNDWPGCERILIIKFNFNQIFI